MHLDDKESVENAKKKAKITESEKPDEYISKFSPEELKEVLEGDET